MADPPAPERTPEEEVEAVLTRFADPLLRCEVRAELTTLLTHHAEEKGRLERGLLWSTLSAEFWQGHAESEGAARDVAEARLAEAQADRDRDAATLNAQADLIGTLRAERDALAENRHYAYQRLNEIARAVEMTGKDHFSPDAILRTVVALAAQLAQCQHEASAVLEAENAALRKALEDKDPLMGILWPMLRVWGEECQSRKMESRRLTEERDRLADALAQCKEDQHATRAMLSQQRDEAREALREIASGDYDATYCHLRARAALGEK